MYINSPSKHPKSVREASIDNIGEKIPMLSSDHVTFKRHVLFYNKALKEAGYKSKIKFVND